jgi:2-C-methyl-D-erythritol 4-phosphate cytidylyltransferase
MAKFAVIFPAAGRSERFQDKRKKPFVDLDGRALWIRAVEPFLNRDDVIQLILVVADEDREEVERRYRANLAFMGVQLARGGAERTDSVASALRCLKNEVDYVAVHDAVRPCVTPELIERVFAAAVQFGAAVPALPVVDTLKRVRPGRTVIAETVPRSDLWLAQTPQAFRRQLLEEAYAQRPPEELFTDDAQLVERLGVDVHLVPGSPFNIKVTVKEDLLLAKAVLEAIPKPKPKGPLHPFAEDQMWR